MTLNDTRSSNQPFVRYEPALDGLRAISVIAVIIYHAGFTWLGGGFLGVEVFFVVSGLERFTSQRSQPTQMLVTKDSPQNSLAPSVRASWMQKAAKQSHAPS